MKMASFNTLLSYILSYEFKPSKNNSEAFDNDNVEVEMTAIKDLLSDYTLNQWFLLNLVGGTEPHKFHTCIHRTLRSWSFFILQIQNICL